MRVSDWSKFDLVQLSTQVLYVEPKKDLNMCVAMHASGSLHRLFIESGRLNAPAEGGVNVGCGSVVALWSCHSTSVTPPPPPKGPQHLLWVCGSMLTCDSEILWATASDYHTLLSAHLFAQLMQSR